MRKRLDRFMEEMEHWPHGMVVKAIRMKKLKVNGKKEDGTYRLCEGDRVVSYVLPKEKGAISRLCMKMSTY